MDSGFKGFGFSGYRSIGEQTVRIGPLKKINFIIGQNNAGKSNIINYLYRHYSRVLDLVNKGRGYHARNTPIEPPFSEIDKALGSQNSRVSIAFALDETSLDSFIQSLMPSDLHRLHQVETEICLRKLLSTFRADKGLYWFEYHAKNDRDEFTLECDRDAITGILTKGEWYLTWSRLTGSSNGDLHAHWIPEVINKIAYKPNSVPNIEVIPAIRRIGDSGSVSEDFSGTGIIDRLSRLENPALSERRNLEKFSQINHFLRTVLDNETATITIPYERDTILVDMDGRILPLASLGTGIHEVIILASASTILEDSIVCIEEPELHLHPHLQKKLVKYLAFNTSNQYIFTTHSAHLLDAVEAEIFHVTQSSGITQVDAVDSTCTRSDICRDLGYRASDILQANCVIWVEGPSDRIYLNYWLSALNTSFVEGIHYSIMFYGGRLFSHLTALDNNDDQVNDFISVRKLNRNAVIMFDSDAPKARCQLNATKKRLRDEFNAGPGFTWITKGREVENYLDPVKLQQCIMSVHPSAILSQDTDMYSNLLNYRTRKKNEIATANKVKVAREYVGNFQADLTVLDLKVMTEKLRDFIASCN